MYNDEASIENVRNVVRAMSEEEKFVAAEEIPLDILFNELCRRILELNAFKESFDQLVEKGKNLI